MTYHIKELQAKVNEIFPQVVELRRQLHMYPELSGEEEETGKFIQSELNRLDIPYQSSIASHGICATIYGKDRSRGVGIRADMDALPLTERADVPFKSRKPGIMHGCGHDIHTAILLGTARILNEMKKDLSGSVRLLFQPSEETIGGAKQMIDAGCLENPKISSVIGLHVDPFVDAGCIQFIPGAMNAASCEFYVTVIGKSCHGAHPAEGIDSLLASCTMVSSLQSIITRKIDPAEAALITVGQFHSGTKNNIISGETRFSGIIRTLNMENRSFIKKQIEEVCTATAQAYGAVCSIEFCDSYPSLENDRQLLDWIRPACEEALGRTCVFLCTKPSLGADDFAYFCHGTRGLYYNIGTRRPGDKDPYPIHSDRFDPDEECIRAGILTEVLAVLKILEEEDRK